MKKILIVLTLIASISSFAQTKRVLECQVGETLQATFMENGSDSTIRLSDGIGGETSFKLDRSLKNIKLNDSDTLVGTSEDEPSTFGEFGNAVLIRMFKNHQGKDFGTNVGYLAHGGTVYILRLCHKI